MDFKQLNNTEKGLSIRSKLNEMLRNLIKGPEGVSALWTSLSNLSHTVSENKKQVEDVDANVKSAISQVQDYVDTKIISVEGKYTKNKGYFDTETDLKEAWPTSEIGDQAYVGEAPPFIIWRWGTLGWENTGQEGGDDTLNLNNYLKYEDLGAL